MLNALLQQDVDTSQQHEDSFDFQPKLLLVASDSDATSISFLLQVPHPGIIETT